MITKLLDQKNTKAIKAACSLVINKTITLENIDDILCTLLYFEYEVIGEEKIHDNVVYLLKIDIDDILDIKSFSWQKKEQLIAESINQDLELLIQRAKYIISKIDLDEKEASKNAYCPKLMKQ